jgi:hypothetical protein
MTLGGRAASIVDLIHGPEIPPLVTLTVRAFDTRRKEDVFLQVSITEKHPVLVRYNLRGT